MKMVIRSLFHKAQMSLGLFVLVTGLFVLGASHALAAATIAPLVSYQARLMDPSGFPVADGTYSVQFSMYDAPTAGNRVWTAAGTLGSPTAISVSVQNGLFSVLLGDTGQNTLDTVDWNQDNLYIGVTISADAEMTPRRRLAAVPQAFNARQLQGMYASSTAFGAASVFTVNQTSNTSATGTRTALEVRSSGTNNSNDFLIRGVNDLANTVFSVNRQGNVTTTGDLVVVGTASTSQLLVAGQLVCLANGTNCTAGSGSSTDLNWTFNAAGGFVRNATPTTDLVLGSTATSTGAAAYFDLSGGTNGNSTVYFGHGTNTNVVIGGTSTTQTGLASFFTMNGDDVFVHGDIGAASNMFTNGAFVAGDATAYADGFISQLSGSLAISASQGIYTADRFSALYLNRWFLSPLLNDTVYGGARSTTTVTGTPTGLAFDGSHIWVSKSSSGSVGKIDPTNSFPSVTTVPVGTSPQGIAFDGSSIWVVNNGTDNVSKIDVATLAVVATTTVGTSPANIAYADGFVWVSNLGSANVTKINTGTNTVAATVPVGTTPRGVAFDGNYIWVASTVGDNVSKIDINTNTVVATVSVGDGPNGIAFDGSHMWVVNSIAGTVSKLDVRLNTVVATTTVGSAPSFVAFDGNHIWVTNTGSDNVSKIDINTNAVVATVSVGDGPSYIAFDGSHMWVANSADSVSKLPIGGGSGADMSLHVNLVPDTDNTFDIGSVTNAFRNIYAAADVLVGGVSVCLESGTNCPASSGGTDLNWTFNAAGDFVRNATPTTDLVLGSTATSTGAPAYFDLAGGTTGNSNFYFGHNTNTNVVIGGTSTTQTGLNSLFVMNGDDLFVHGNIGSVSSIYTNGAFIAGPGSTYYGNGYLNKNDIGLFQLSAVSGTRVVNQLLQSWGEDVTPQQLGFIGLVADALFTEIRGNLAYVAAADGFLYIIDVTDSASPRLLSSIDTGLGSPVGFDVQGHFAYFAGSASLTVIDISNASTPVLGLSEAIGQISDLDVDGRFLYVSKKNLILIYQLDNPAVSLGTAISSSQTGVSKARARNGFLYALFPNTTGLSVIDVRDPNNPVQLGTLALGGSETALDIVGNYAYVVTTSLAIVDVSDPSNLVAAPDVAGIAAATQVTVAGRYAYVVDGADIKVVDVKTSSTASVVKTISGFAADLGAIKIVGQYGYIGLINAGPGFQIINLAGQETYALTAHSLNAGTLDVLGEATFGQGLQVRGGLNVGYLGIASEGPISSYATNVTSSFAGGLTVQGQAVCMADGRYCASASFPATDPYSFSVVNSLTASLSNPIDVAAEGNTLYVADNAGRNIHIFDVTDPSNPIELGSTPAEGAAMNSVFVEGDVAYATIAAASNTLAIYDVSNPAAPTFIASKRVGTEPIDVAVSNGYAYVVNGSTDNVSVIDVSDPSNPIGVATTTVGTNPNAIHISGNYAYVANTFSDSISVIDITDPLHPFVVNTVTVGGQPAHLFVTNGYAYTANSQFGVNSMSIVDVSDPANAFVVTTTFAGVGPLAISVAGRYAYLTNTHSGGHRMSLVDVSDPYHPFVATSTESGFSGNNMVISGRYAYIANFGFNQTVTIVEIQGEGVSDLYASNGSIGNLGVGEDLSVDGTSYLSSLNFISATGSSLQMTSMAFATTSILYNTGDQATSLLVRGNYLYLNDDNAVSIFDISQGATTTFLYTSSTLPDGVNWLALNGDYLYAFGGRFRIFDVSSPGNPVSVATFSSTFSTSIGLRGVVSGKYLYSVPTGQFRISDVSDPTAPTSTASLPVAGITSTPVVQGNYAYVVATNDTIINISDPTRPFVAGTLSGTSDMLEVAGSYLYRKTPADNFEVWDISDVVNPVQVGVVSSTAGGNDMVVVGRFVFATHITGGTTVYDVSNPYAPTLVRSFPTTSFALGIDAGSQYVYVADGTAGIRIIDMGGLDVNAAQIGSLGANDLKVSGNTFIGNDLSVMGALNVGSGGFQVSGNAGINGISASSALQVVNRAPSASGTSWGAYIDQLTVGSNAAATGTANYSMVITYASGTGSGGVCIDDTATLATCPTNPMASLSADGTINANAFDLAEMYDITGSAEPGDLLVLDQGNRSTVKKSEGTAYDARVIGIVSTRPGFVLGWQGGVQVALTGRVPLKVALSNGPISIGDALTSSNIPGYAMKATKPGMIVGYALEDLSATGTLEAFVSVGYSASSVLNTDGTTSRINDDLVFAPRETASGVNPTADSWGLTFRGSVWDSMSSSVVSRDFSILNDVISSTSSLLTIRNSNGTSIFTMDEAGNASFKGDVQIDGRLFPSSRGVAQDDFYIFLDNQAPTGSYMATNADGWQSMDTYDFAERFYSPDELQPGDLVVVKNTGNHHVQRAWNETDMLVGIVSTRPAFIAGRPATNTHPIALSGRVPTKVSSIKGAIKAGDPLAPSTLPGVAVKATKTGPIVGLALEDYDVETIGLIEVNVNPGWWTAPEVPKDPETAAQQAPIEGMLRRGMARIDAGVKKVSVSFESIGSYPFVQVTPRGLIVGGWGTENYTDKGFDIVLAEAQSFNAYFSWQVEPMQVGDRLFQSDGTFLDLDLMTGQAVEGQAAEAIVQPVAPTSTVESGDTTSPEAPVADSDVPPVEEPVSEPVPEPVSEPSSAPETEPVPEAPVAEPAPEPTPEPSVSEPEVVQTATETPQ